MERRNVGTIEGGVGGESSKQGPISAKDIPMEIPGKKKVCRRSVEK